MGRNEGIVTIESLVEIWEITEMRNGAVFRTRNTGETRWVEIGEKPEQGILFVTISDPKVKTIRSVQ
mgnify:CR=1 FL=1